MNEGVMIERVRQEWVAPKNTWWSDGRIYAGAIAIQTNSGWLLLAWVERVISGPKAGDIRRVLVLPEEIATEYFLPWNMPEEKP